MSILLTLPLNLHNITVSQTKWSSIELIHLFRNMSHLALSFPLSSPVQSSPVDSLTTAAHISFRHSLHILSFISLSRLS